jgi:flagellar motor switch protein FliN/FliY
MASPGLATILTKARIQISQGLTPRLNAEVQEIDMADEKSLELNELEDQGASQQQRGGSNLDNGASFAEMADISEMPRNARDLEAVYDIPVQVSAVLGKATMQVSQLLKLGRGAVVELDRKVGEAIDIYVNNRLVARGEVVVVEERLGVTMTEIIKTDRM